MSIQFNQNPLLHFHDGIGDILQETRPTKLAFIKPIWVSLLVGILSLLSFAFVFSVVLNQFFRQPRLVIPDSVLNETLIQQQNDNLIKEMELLLAQSEPPLTLPPDHFPPLSHDPSRDMSKPPTDPSRDMSKPPTQLSSIATPSHSLKPSKSMVKLQSKTVSKNQVTLPPSVPSAKSSPPPTATKPDSSLSASPRSPHSPAKRPSPLPIRFRVVMPHSSMADAIKTRVRLNTLGIDSIIKSNDTAIWLQLGAFVDKKSATDTMEAVQKKGFSAQLVE